MAISNLLNLSYCLKNEDTSVNCDRLMVFYLLAFALLYTLIPFLFYQNILPDSAQNIAWGRTWEWSYNRHPPLGTWFIKLMIMFIGNIELATFSASACCLSISLWFIYKLSKQFLSQLDALIACILSSFSVFYLMYYALEFNQNTIMLPFWVMCCYFFDKCLKVNRTLDWLLLGALTAAAILAKYESIIMLFSLVLYLVVYFKKQYLVNLILAFSFALILLAPHLLSVVEKGFLPWVFMQGRVGDGLFHGFIYNHFYNPFKAMLEQFVNLSPALLTFVLLLSYKQFLNKSNQTNMLKSSYLVYIGFVPCLFVLSISLLFGISLRSEWSYPLFSFTLPALIYYFQFKAKPKMIAILFIAAFCLHFGVLVMHKSVHYFSNKDARSNFPSYQLANLAQSYWEQFTDKPIYYVGGEEDIDYYLSTYLPSKPVLFEAYSFTKSHWIKPKDLKSKGLLLVVSGCDPLKIKSLQEQYQIQAHQCVNIPLNNKFHPQFKLTTFMIVPPKAD
ncbi:MAG: glycosyltransferase family 39 protein [Tatlockia sp.]|nr:glycosyltransferase family 39 protein [Tatlockia sp.]